MSITHGIEILNITPSNKEELRLVLAAQRTNNPGEYYSWKNHEADSWTADFIFDKERRALNEVSFLDGEFFYYIIPKNVLKEMAKAINEKDFGEDLYDYGEVWEEICDEPIFKTLEYLAIWIQKNIDTMNESECFCY